MEYTGNVSIPFKRESVSEHKKGELSGFLQEFQFPSNGKAYLNGIWVAVT